jgi:hypothetical protein
LRQNIYLSGEASHAAAGKNNCWLFIESRAVPCLYSIPSRVSARVWARDPPATIISQPRFGYSDNRNAALRRCAAINKSYENTRILGMRRPAAREAAAPIPAVPTQWLGACRPARRQHAAQMCPEEQHGFPFSRPSMSTYKTPCLPSTPPFLTLLQLPKLMTPSPSPILAQAPASSCCRDQQRQACSLLLVARWHLVSPAVYSADQFAAYSETRLSLRQPTVPVAQPSTPVFNLVLGLNSDGALLTASHFEPYLLHVLSRHGTARSRRCGSLFRHLRLLQVSLIQVRNQS